MADIGRYNNLPVVGHADFGFYLDGGMDGDILLPKRYIPKGIHTEVGSNLRVFIYLDSEDRLVATTEKPKALVGEFASLRVKQTSPYGLFLDWGLPKDLLLPHSEVKRPLKVDDYGIVYLYLDDKTNRIAATTYLDRHLDIEPGLYQSGEAVNLLIAARTDIGFKAIINNRHWGLIHNNEVFKFLRGGMREKGYIKEVRDDGKISLSLQPVGDEGRGILQSAILQKLAEGGGILPLGDKSPPEVISRLFGVSKSSFKKAIGALFKQGRLVIYPDRIELQEKRKR